MPEIHYKELKAYLKKLKEGRDTKQFAPVYLILPREPAALARTAVVCLALAGLGALAPVRLIAGMDPAVVFRS